jgi:hypothetical protein
MKHMTALLIKFVMISVILEIALNLMTNLTFGDTLYIAAIVTILAYIIGDLLILPTTNNTVATVADAVLALATIYTFNFIWGVRYISFLDALIAAAVLGLGEWFFHKYVEDNVFHKRTEH